METPDRKQVLRSSPIYPDNPFLERDDIACMKTTKKLAYRENRHEAYAPATAEQIGQCDGFYRRMEVDSEKFVKIYLQGIGALSRLKSPGLKVFKLLYIELQNHIEKDRVPMSSAVAASKHNIKPAIFLRGISELINAEFIAKTPYAGLFWINPAYIFNGNRIRLVTDFELKEDER